MTDWLKFALLSFACYRLAQLVAFDEGPFRAFHWLRVWLGAYTLDNQGRAETALGRLISCPYCLGIWIALPLSLYAIGIQWYTLVWWFAIAGAQAFLQSKSNG